MSVRGTRQAIAKWSPGLVRVAGVPLRAWNAFGYYLPRVREILRWSLQSREFGNFTYGLTPDNYEVLAYFVSVVTRKPVAEIRIYLKEILEDVVLRQHVLEVTRGSPHRFESDDVCEVGRRAGWYAIARATKPSTIIETGVDKGLGSIVLCSALVRNAEEGWPGTYYGTDINPTAGWLLTGKYATHGKLLFGDSIETLSQFDREIDLFINDSDHSFEYEWREYLTVESKLSAKAIVIGDNAHVSSSLMRFAAHTGRRFLFFKEQPDRHWYPGAGIGFAFGTDDGVDVGCGGQPGGPR